MKPSDLAQLAATLAAKSGKTAREHMPEAVELLALAVSMLPEVERKIAQFKARKLVEPLTLAQASKQLGVSKRTTQKYLDDIEHGDRAITPEIMGVLRGRINEAKSRKPNIVAARRQRINEAKSRKPKK